MYCPCTRNLFIDCNSQECDYCRVSDNTKLLDANDTLLTSIIKQVERIRKNDGEEEDEVGK